MLGIEKFGKECGKTFPMAMIIFSFRVTGRMIRS
jgi:hypothetical protein